MYLFGNEKAKGFKYKAIEVNCERVSFIQLEARNKDEKVPKKEVEQ